MPADPPTRSFEEQLRALSQALPASVFITDADGLIRYVNPYWSAFTGLSSEETLGSAWIGVLHPDDAAATIRAWADAGRAERSFHTEVRCRSAEGGWLWVLARIAPIRSPAGVVNAWIGVSNNIDERRRSEDESRLRQARFEALVRASATIVFELDQDGHRKGSNLAWRAFSGERFDDPASGSWTIAVHPDQRAGVTEAWEQALRERRPLDVEVRLWRESAGAYRWVQAHVVPVMATDGSVREWIGALTDIHEKKSAAETQHTLVLELQHRVRNSLAVIRSLSAQTGRYAVDVPDFVARFDGRLNALAYALGLLTRTAETSVDLADLVQSVLQPFRNLHGVAIRIEGPRLTIGPTSATNLSLAFHELATNAVKYGALSRPEGRIDLAWRADDGVVTLTWRESGGPPAKAPSRRGFGSRLLAQTLNHEAEGKVSLTYESEGFSCAMRWRLSDRIEPGSSAFVPPAPPVE
jgi:PAS domain S-box-containing protein